MKTEYLYLRLRYDGDSDKLIDGKFEKVSLTAILAEGWRPIRETPMSQDNAILICLDREPEGQKGFGFGP